MSDEKFILTVKSNSVLIVTMNRPSALNSLHPRLIEELINALKLADRDPGVNVIVLTGAGKAFCAGGDLPYIDSLDNSVDSYKYIELAGNITKTIANLDKPVIAMVNGVATGAGFNIALACDIIYCAKSARFAQSFSKVDLISDCGGTYFLPRVVGLYKAKELLFTGDMINSNEAKELGIVNKVMEDENLVEETYKLANKLASAAPIAIKYIKKTLNRSFELDLNSALELEAGIQNLCIQTDDNKEGIAAFKEKREARFLGK